MVNRAILAVALALMAQVAVAQEVLLPVATSQYHSTAKSSSVALELPLFDDFAGVSGQPSSALWEVPSGANVNDGYAALPPTVGMATLDAADAEGRLYSHASTSVFGADTLCSRRVRLDGYSPADSVVLSFYYLPGGGSGNMWERIGDAPEAQDSLFVDFFSAADSAWHTVWRTPGTTVQALLDATGQRWQPVRLTIKDSSYFDSVFRFRFRNLASVDDNGLTGAAGNCDQWNVDYVELAAGGLSGARRDVAFVSPAPSMLLSYRAMPARQYRVRDMAAALSMTITNLYDDALASRYAYAVVDDATGDTLHRYDGGYENAPANGLAGNYQTAAAHAAPPVQFAFPEGQAARSYTIIHTVREGTGGDVHAANDTVRFVQHLADYYAYDDGTAENGYGLASTSARIYLACRFDMAERDTLTAVDIYFNSTLADANSSVRFKLTVWSAGSDGTPAEVLYSDSEKRSPQGLGFERYSLEHPVEVYGTVFVGIEQVGAGYINIGFDRSYNSADKVWYHTATTWQQSILSGSLMLRPCFGTAALAAHRIADIDANIWPNPCTDVLRLSLPDGAQACIFDASGRRVSGVLSGTDCMVRTAEWPSGIYYARIEAVGGRSAIKKIVVLH